MKGARTTLYRDKINGKMMGVCSGIADYTGVNVAWVRIAAVISIFVSQGLSIPSYFIAGFVLNQKPNELYVDEQEQQYWQGVRQSPARTAREIRSRFRDIDRRLADVETYYVSNNPRLTAEIEQLR